LGVGGFYGTLQGDEGGLGAGKVDLLEGGLEGVQGFADEAVGGRGPGFGSLGAGGDLLLHGGENGLGGGEVALLKV
jgi:hypothetical protein